MIPTSSSSAASSLRFARQTLSALALVMFLSPAIAAEPASVMLAAGQRLVVVVAENKPGAEAFRDEFFAKAVGRARELGYRDALSLRIDEVVSGGKTPHAAVWVSWPSPAASEEFRADPIYAEQYGPRRAEGWTEMQSFYADLQEPLSFQVDPTKHHTLAVLWLNDAQSFDEYFRATESLRAELGCRMLMKVPVKRYDSIHDKNSPLPQWVILTEWQDREGPAQYINSETFKRYQAQHDAAIARIEMYRLGFW